MIVFGENEAHRIHRSVQRTEKMPLDETRPRRRGPVDEFYETDDDPGEGGGSGLCCCQENNCLRIDGVPYKTKLEPVFYEFFNKEFRCHCDPPGDAGSVVRLYKTENPKIWKSRHGARDPLMCLGDNLEPEDCTVTATWKWKRKSCEIGVCAYVSAVNSNPACNVAYPYKWVFSSSSCSEGCECDSIEIGECVLGALHPSGPGQFMYIDCVESGSTGEWVLEGVDDEECECTPEPPDYDGTEDGEGAETSCDGIKYVVGEETLYPSYWLLTINDTPDYYGCNQTKLEFIINTTAVYTYYLDRRCEPERVFCPNCTNTFKVSRCGPTQCDVEQSSTICLDAKYAKGEKSIRKNCCSPATWLVEISGFKGFSEAPLGTNSCPFANGTWLFGEMNYDDYSVPYPDDGLPRWVYNWLGPIGNDQGSGRVFGTQDEIDKYFTVPRLWYAVLTCHGVNDGTTEGHPEYFGRASMSLEIFAAAPYTKCPIDSFCWPPDSICSTKGVRCGDFEISPLRIYFGQVNVAGSDDNTIKCDDEPSVDSVLSVAPAAQYCLEYPDAGHETRVYIRAI